MNVHETSASEMATASVGKNSSSKGGNTMLTRTASPAPAKQTKKAGKAAPASEAKATKPARAGATADAKARKPRQPAAEAPKDLGAIAIKQQKFLDDAMETLQASRAELAALIGISKRGLDKWMCPTQGPDSDFREMPEMAWKFIQLLLEHDAQKKAGQKKAK